MIAGQVSDEIGAAALSGSLPKVEWWPKDSGYSEGERHWSR